MASLSGTIGIVFSSKRVAFCADDSGRMHGTTELKKPARYMDGVERGGSSHAAEIERYISGILDAVKPALISIPAASYSMGETFSEAKAVAKAIGVTALLAHKRGILLIEVPQIEVAKIATGKTAANREDYLAALRGGGVAISSEYVAEAYWARLVGDRYRNDR